jgi:aryl-alcohol dehydrogenase-like predicted oxidoreductase
MTDSVSIRKSLMGECTKETTFSILDKFHASGGNFIDTANIYMAGESEQWIGEWMALRNVRDQMVIATKYGVPNRNLMTEPTGAVLSNFGGTNRKSLRLSLDASLKNLRTDHIEIFYVHTWEAITAIPELMRALDDLIRDGKILYLGVCNWPSWAVVKANEYARQHGLTPFSVYQGRWNPAERQIEREVLPMCKAEGMGITVWSALGGGKFRIDAQTAENDDGRTYTDDLGGASLEDFKKFAVVMQKVGERRGTNALGVALRYVMLKVGCLHTGRQNLADRFRFQAPYVFPVIGGRKVEHLEKNIAALHVELNGADVAEIEAAVPFDFEYPHSLLSGDRYKPISAADPGAFVRLCGYFDGVEEPKVCLWN